MKIGIIGAGLNGLALALLLKRLGARAEVYERGDGPRDTGSGIYVWPQGVQVLRFMLGDDRLRAAGQPIEFLDTLDRRGTLIHSQPVRLEGFEFPAPAMMFLRKRLFGMMRDSLDAHTITTDAGCESISQDDKGVTVSFTDGSSRRFDVVIGADGVFSRVRDAVAPEAIVADTGVAACRGIVEFSHPTLLGDRCQIFTYDSARVVTYPLDESRSLRYWFYAYRHLDRPLLDKVGIRAAIDAIADPLPAMVDATPPESMLHNRLHAIKHIENWNRGRVTLLGDSAHAMLPTLGYGFTLGLENGFALAQSLVCNGDAEITSALRRYSRRVRQRSREMLEVMSDLTDLFYFREEGSVTSDTLQDRLTKFRGLAETTVF
jgi:2-polyprenyl-6-methoxyphenol hydroxylase-like FAD-dependent oxidoreductase